MIYLPRAFSINNSILITFFLIICSIHVFSQNEEIYLNQQFNNLSWVDFVKKTEAEFKIRYFYDTNEFPAIHINFVEDRALLLNILSNHLSPLGFYISMDHQMNIFLSKEPIKTSVIESFLDDFSKKTSDIIDQSNQEITENKFIQTEDEFISKEIIVGSKELGNSNIMATISGFVKDANSGENISGATIALPDMSEGVATDENGLFKIQLKKGKHNLIISNLGKKDEKIQVDLLSDGILEIYLEDEAILLQEAIVSAKKYDKVIGTEMGIEKITAKSVKEIPLVMGEKDVIKVALLLPGIQTVGEGSSGFNVRGSPTDQNLFYINSLPIYNTSHLSGFFSSFNSDIIDEFALYKSNIPVKYGGRLSSIFEITAKQGHKERYKASGGISPITGRVLAEGPIQKGKSSFIVGLRSTYSDWLLKLAKNANIKESSAKFGDAVVNFSFNLSPKDQLNFFSYFSYDKMNLSKQAKYEYENIGSSIHWKHIFNKVNSHNLSLVHSIYNFSEESNELAIASYKHSNKLEHSEVKSNFEINSIKNHKINFGINSTYYKVFRGKYEPLSLESLIESKELGNEQGLESALFISNEWNILPRFTINAGLRYNLYLYLGPQYVYTYLEGLPKNDINCTGNIQFNKGEIVKSYNGLDYRLASNYLINNDFSIKFSYNRQHQFIYMLSNSIAISPDYKWKLTDYHTKPIIGDHYAAGLFLNSYLGGSPYSLSLEVYYKTAKNLVEIKDGANLIMNEFSEQNTLQGKLKTYGFEFMMKKSTGKLNGWFNYTYSKAVVKVDSEYPENQINFGNPYPSNYDKPHALNLVANYRAKRRLSISGNVVYSTGRPITYPSAIYYQNGIKTLHYSKRNEYRIPDYFRIDLSITIDGNLKKNKIAHGSWTFSVYNVTGRKNAYSVYFRYEEGQINGYKLSIFGSPIFSLTYNFKLGNYAN